jgi:hypothetical protein
MTFGDLLAGYLREVSLKASPFKKENPVQHGAAGKRRPAPVLI